MCCLFVFFCVTVEPSRPFGLSPPYERAAGGMRVDEPDEIVGKNKNGERTKQQEGVRITLSG